MKIVFDPAKDEANRLKHGVSLARSCDLEMVAVLQDQRREYGEIRYRAFGFIEGVAHCLAFTVREGEVRAISLRCAREKEMKRYVRQGQASED